MAAVFTTSDITNKKSAGAMRALQANAVIRFLDNEPGGGIGVRLMAPKA